ncbi:MAG: efflux RND transporter periplasmic adaptor subunit, partial [Boseongicola sp.]|nr:efflux RND transporter periplasmic adaptor subunit [Boseongicola sp.]
MRLFPIITAVLVVGVLFLLVFQRDELVTFSGAQPEVAEEEVISAVVDRDENAPPSAVSVVAIRSSASSIDGAVILRGRTEAARQVDMRAETSGQVISDPLRAGATVEEGDLLCRLDPGTRAIALAEAEASLREAITRLPEAEARVAESRARLTEAEINDNAAERLSEGGFASETRVAQATASVEAARAGVQAAISGVESARSGIQSAEARVAAAQNQLDQLEVRAPFGGILETDSAEIGSLMQP